MIAVYGAYPPMNPPWIPVLCTSPAKAEPPWEGTEDSRCLSRAPRGPMHGEQPWLPARPHIPQAAWRGRAASLNLGMWAGQSGAGWPRVGRRQSRTVGQLAAMATQGRRLPTLSTVSIEQMEKLSPWGQLLLEGWSGDGPSCLCLGAHQAFGD